MDLMKIDWEDAEMLKTMRDTVARGANDNEFKLFCAIARSTGLNPFLKQVWFIKGKKYQNKKGEWVDPPAQIMTGIDGYRAIANSHAQFDGVELLVDRDAHQKPRRCTAKVYRKDRKYPAVAEVLFSEYYKSGINGNQSTWDKNPTVMIEKVAESLAIRRAFPLEVGAIRTFEEMGVDETDLSQDEKDAAIETESVNDTRTYYDLDAIGDANEPIVAERDKLKFQKYLIDSGATFIESLSLFVAPRKLEKLSACIVDADFVANRSRLAMDSDIKAREQSSEIEAPKRIEDMKQDIASRGRKNEGDENHV
jgi:phage recombination protein Bet